MSNGKEAEEKEKVFAKSQLPHLGMSRGYVGDTFPKVSGSAVWISDRQGHDLFVWPEFGHKDGSVNSLYWQNCQHLGGGRTASTRVVADVTSPQLPLPM